MAPTVSMSDLPDRASTDADRKKTDDLTRQGGKLQKLCNILPAGIWKGRRVFIVGGGTSLRGFDFKKLEGEIVITLNRGFEHFPDSVLNLAMDARLWGWYEDENAEEDVKKKFSPEAKKKWKEYQGYKTWLNCQVFPYPEDLKIIDMIGDANPDWDLTRYNQGLPMTTNTGLSALLLATVLGAETIYILGFDMYGEKSRTANFHEGYPDSNQSEVYKDSFVPDFERFAEQVKKTAKVVNLNPKSELPFFEKAEFDEVVKPIKRPVVISFYTPEYEEDAKRLRTSVRNYGFQLDLLKLEKKIDNSWLRTIYWRAEFVLQMLTKWKKRDVLWVDADAEFMKYPELFENFKADFAAHWHNWTKDDRGRELLGGTMFFRNCASTIAFVKAWIDLNKQIPNAKLSQHVLARAWDKWGGKDKTVELPAAYCQIFDSMADEGEPVIHHYQASRRTRES